MVAEVEGSLRTYRLSRLVEATLLEDPFARPADFDLAQYWQQSTQQFKSTLPRYPAKLKVNTLLLPRLQQERYVRIQETEALPDGGILATVEFETLESAGEIALSFAASIEVLEPQELREHVIAAVRATANRYGV
jgi:predicted DNA-binding transcriptional regulator YafY